MCKYYVILLLAAISCNGYNILGLFPTQLTSHFFMFEKLLKGLVDKGHTVDVLSHFPQETPIPRYNDLSVFGTAPLPVNNLTVSILHDKNLYSLFHFAIKDFGTIVCEAIFNTEVAKNLKTSRKKYDVIIIEVFASDCLLGYAHLFDVPVIGIMSSIDLPWGSDRIGNPDNPSYISNYFLSYISPMSVTERLLNTLTLVAFKIGYQWNSVKVSNQISQRFFGPDVPHLNELIYKTDLLLVNSHFSIKFCGSWWITHKRTKIVIENILNSDPTGFIYLSMGSMVLSESFSARKLQALLDAFRNLPYTVLWKGTREHFSKSLNVPQNVRFEKWMPQIEILCHPKVMLFVTHGGLLGVQEAIYCGKPLLGIPLFADHALNVRSLQKKEEAIMVSYENITNTSIFTAITELLVNPKYKTNAEKTSILFRDRPLSPLETAIYWVEYVIRHKGAKHLRSPGTDLSWYQYYLIDVAVIVLSAIIAFISIIYYLIRVILKLVKSTKTKIKQK